MKMLIGIMTVTAALALQANAEAPGGGDPGGRRGPPPDGEGRRPRLENGERPDRPGRPPRPEGEGRPQLSQEQREAMAARREEMRKKALKEFDADGDGTLSEDERAQMREAMQKRRQERRTEMLKKFDADGDGKLSPEERKEMRKSMVPPKA